MGNESTTVLKSQASKRYNNGDALNVDLAQFGVTYHKMRLQHFNQHVPPSNSLLFVMILADPPCVTPLSCSRAGSAHSNFVSDWDMNSLVQFARKLICSVGWMFLFTSVSYIGKCLAAFKSCVFSSSRYPYVIMKDTSSMREYRGNEFPQDACEL